MALSYLIAILLTLVAAAPKIRARERLTLMELLIFVLVMTSPWSLTRDVPQYMENFENFLDIDSFPEIVVRLMMAGTFIGGMEVMFRSDFSIGSIIAYAFLAIPSVACNQLRLSLALLVLLLLMRKTRSIGSVLAGSLIHQSLVLYLFMRLPDEPGRRYALRIALLAGVAAAILLNFETLLGLLLPYLGNVGVYLHAKEISDLYDETNLFEGIEFPFFYGLVSLQARSPRPAIAVGLAYALTKVLTMLPSVITMRFFELFCILYLFSKLRHLKHRTVPIVLFGLVLLARFYLHYSVMPDTD